MKAKVASYDKKIDKRWIIGGLLLILLIIIVSLINVGFVNNTIDKINGTITTDDGDLKINWNRYPTYDIVLSETITITDSATYHITGSLDDGAIIIKANHDTGKIRLVLDNAIIRNSTGPAIACYSADDLVIEVVNDNYLEDGSNYSADYDEDVTGVIYSKDDLTFQGNGNLTVISNYQDAIVGKDDLKFNSGSYLITANDDGIRGKDSVYIVAGIFEITAKADAIKSTNETDNGKGFVLVEDGNFKINSGEKGIKATNSILIQGGEYSITSYDDAIHSNNYVGIIDGSFTIYSGDDGIHADKELVVSGGSIDITKSYEGLEAQAITINGGKVNIDSSDDGINAGGGADASANNRRGAGRFDADTSCILTINGGEIYINAAGDGIDSNGYLYFNGGKVVVDGPTNNGNGALDAGAGIVMNGGEVIAVGASGMAESLGSDSSINNISIYFDSTLSANTKIEIKESTGELVLEHTSAKSFNHLAVGSTEFQTQKSYIIYINGEKYNEFIVSGTMTTVGNSSLDQNMLPGERGRPNPQSR